MLEILSGPDKNPDRFLTSRDFPVKLKMLRKDAQLAEKKFVASQHSSRAENALCAFFLKKKREKRFFLFSS